MDGDHLFGRKMAFVMQCQCGTYGESKVNICNSLRIIYMQTTSNKNQIIQRPIMDTFAKHDDS